MQQIVLGTGGTNSSSELIGPIQQSASRSYSPTTRSVKNPIVRIESVSSNIRKVMLYVESEDAILGTAVCVAAQLALDPSSRRISSYPSHYPVVRILWFRSATFGSHIGDASALLA